MLINFWEIRSLSGLQRIRSPCCQLTKHEQKLLSEKKVGSFPKCCVCPALWEASCEAAGSDLREAARVISSGFKSQSWVKERTGRRQLGKNILDGSSEESSVPQGWVGSQKLLSQESCFSKCNRPAFESSLTTGECGLMEMGQCRAMDIRMGAGLWVPAPLAAVQPWLRTTAPTAHPCSAPQMQENLCVIPPGPSSSVRF